MAARRHKPITFGCAAIFAHWTNRHIAASAHIRSLGNLLLGHFMHIELYLGFRLAGTFLVKNAPAKLHPRLSNAIATQLFCNGLLGLGRICWVQSRPKSRGTSFWLCSNICSLDKPSHCGLGPHPLAGIIFCSATSCTFRCTWGSARLGRFLLKTS